MVLGYVTAVLTIFFCPKNIYFFKLSGFPNLFGKVNSPNLNFKLLLCGSNVNKSV